MKTRGWTALAVATATCVATIVGLVATRSVARGQSTKPTLLLGRRALTPLEQVWYSGSGNRHYLLDFSGAQPAAVSGGVVGQSPGSEGGASFTDPATGKLLLYSDGLTVFNGRTNRSLANGTGLRGDPSAGAAALIAPAPGSRRDLFYLFTNSTNHVSYSIADLSDGANAQVTIKNRGPSSIGPETRPKPSSLLDSQG